VFSGEGGDELFAGHPVYTADKVARLVDWLPRTVLDPLTRMLQRLPDSDEKKNVQVKLKRFAYSLAFSPELLSHRWRTYYTPPELQALCTDGFLASCDLSAVYAGMMRYTREADGPDLLSRSLYSDYQTLVGFYGRRLELLRAFGIDSRLPLLDYRLVEYAARIPSCLKLRGLSETKYLYRKVLEARVPRTILYDRPKLGHSVPMKNWLREVPEAQAMLSEVLGDAGFVSRGLFRTDYIDMLMSQHHLKTHNHSHRLWALLVLALWLQSVRNQ
jgi:asparagine synthase (glutamine-hydrolysing)